LIRIHREKTAEELIRFAIASRLAGRPVEARANLELSIDKKPTFDAFVQLIEIAFEQERFTDAAELVAKARSLVESREQRGRLALLERAVREQLERIDKEDWQFNKLVDALDAYGLIDWFDLAPVKRVILPVFLRPREEMSFPENLVDDALDDYPDGADAYFAFYDAWNSKPPHHRMLGHANVVQDDPVRAGFLQARSLTE